MIYKTIRIGGSLLSKSLMRVFKVLVFGFIAILLVTAEDPIFLMAGAGNVVGRVILISVVCYLVYLIIKALRIYISKNS